MLAIVVGAATIWVIHHVRGTSAHTDCSVVEQLAREYIATTQSVTNALSYGPGEKKDLIAIADQESAMSDKIRAAKASVSAPAIKEHLELWAQGVALTAKTQRDAANQPPTPWQPETPGPDSEVYRAATMTQNATAALRKACPNMPVS